MELLYRIKLNISNFNLILKVKKINEKILNSTKKINI